MSRQRHGRFSFYHKERRFSMQNEKKGNTFTKKIGNATYHVQIYFNKDSKDTFSDKVLRLIKNDIAQKPKAG